MVQGEAALLTLEQILCDDISEKHKKLRSGGLFWEQSKVSFRRSWQAAVLDHEMSRLCSENRDLFDPISHWKSRYSNSTMSEENLLAWHAAIVQLMRRILKRKPRPTRILCQQNKSDKHA